MKNSELTDNIPNKVIKNGSIKIDFRNLVDNVETKTTKLNTNLINSENNTANDNTTVTIAGKNGNNNNLKQCDFCSKDYS